MDQKNPLFTLEEREKLLDELAEMMISGLEKGLILDPDAKESSTFVLERINTITNKNQLEQFLKELSIRWDIYKEAYEKFKREQLLNRVQTELQQLNK